MEPAQLLHNSMPRKKTQKKSKKVDNKKKQKSRVSVGGLRKMITSVRWTESYTSLLMGIVVVIVAVLFVVSFIKQTHHIQDTSSTSTVAVSVTPTTTGVPSELKPGQRTYTVQVGDDLWHIAEKYYKSGYNWVDIAKANNLSDPNSIFSGNQLIIPSVTPEANIVTSTPEVSSGNNTITGATYTVQSGDDLWHIAVRAYADGYQWTKIAKANNLSNSNLIFSGNVLKIPR